MQDLGITGLVDSPGRGRGTSSGVWDRETTTPSARHGSAPGTGAHPQALAQVRITMPMWGVKQFYSYSFLCGEKSGNFLPPPLWLGGKHMFFMATVTQALQDMKSQWGAGWRLTPVSKMRVAPHQKRTSCFYLAMREKQEGSGRVLDWESCASVLSLSLGQATFSLGLTASLPGLCG